jgi:hypothetical protein
MKTIIKVNMDNAAFTDEEGTELARILRKLADNIDGGGLDELSNKLLKDINGNTCGTFKVSNGTFKIERSA